MEVKHTTENKDTVRIIDHSDREWNTMDHQQLVSMNETGPVQGHYMWVDGKSVFANAISTNNKTLFKTHTVLEFDEAIFHQVVMLENSSGSVVAINKDDDSVIAKNLATPPSSYNTLDQVKKDHPEALFYKVPREPGSELFYFKSYLTDKLRILGFNQNGDPMNTAQVQPDQLESQFSMI
ncbi:hypothetical protein OS493_027185 [Desmophyllum pertusum]|uniref:Uncharacterized protein n=1 Tax=Desmophyllum pertusum TaxID=174260 RepID=A0A9X0D881_9CNID|nr:hypothetical protein OS493_027185 [Desmophyllum pertusum]